MHSLSLVRESGIVSKLIPLTFFLLPFRWIGRCILPEVGNNPLQMFKSYKQISLEKFTAQKTVSGKSFNPSKAPLLTFFACGARRVGPHA